MTASASSGAGLPLEDMEFFQFHPTGIYRLGILLTEGARGEGAILRNANGERFMERYAPTIKDLAPRDIVSRCMLQEVAEGRGAGPHRDYVLLDCTHLGAEVLETKLPDITEFARTYLGIDPVVEPMPIQPTAHYAMGGVPTDIDARVLSNNKTVVPGLYAAGEFACVSVHGSNRLGTNSLLDINVFGRAPAASRPSTSSADSSRSLPILSQQCATLLERIRSNRGGERTAVIRTALQETMDVNATVFRTEETLKQAETDIAALKERYEFVTVTDHGTRYNTDLLEAVELGFLLDLAEVLVVSARARRRVTRRPLPRGSSDPRRRDYMMRHTMAYRVDSPSGRGSDQIHLDYKPVTVTRYQPMERKY